MFEKTYSAAEVEPRIYELWERAEAFRAGSGAEPGARAYCIVIPPPNVTGSLHMGHALNNTLQDVLIRFERMRGRDVLWQPGTDHAGIATQMVVERQLAAEGEPARRELGREGFVAKVWEWKERSGGQILNQLKRLGASCDWSRDRFTMDEGLSRAVLKVFVQLYREGLIYRDKRLVNWDPYFETAISDLEVEQVETKGSLWRFRYRLADGATYRHPVEHDGDGNPIAWEERDYLVVATTRPETYLGDTAVAVHPEDPRYAGLVGRHVLLPMVGRRIPIIADHYADPEKGTGAVKITPAHDFNDFQVGKRHDLRQVNVMDSKARMWLELNYEFNEGCEPAAEILALHGLDRYEARERIVALAEAGGWLDGVDEEVHVVPHGDRSKVAVEPWLTDQWFVDAATLAKPAIEAVRSGATRFVPRNWENTYFHWMENIEPWCISRQLWWGHQIPVWYGPLVVDGQLDRTEHTFTSSFSQTSRAFCAMSEVEALEQAREYYPPEYEIGIHDPESMGGIYSEIESKDGKPPVVRIGRDPDVLDTWFSSALWPFSTLGWPDRTPELERYYPTSVLVTGFDIIFFWVARMMMFGLHVMKDGGGRPLVPFHEVYVHALVRDERGKKMSKSLGNIIDPLGLIDDYGADALRFTLASMAAQGRDIKLAPARVQGNRNFATKLWNAARFADMNECRRVEGFDPAAVRGTLARWIVAEAGKTAAAVTEGLESYRFNEAAAAIYQFTWNTFCDWYLELAKPVLAGPDGADKDELRATTAYVIDEIVKLLHPFMPFLTEELWRVTGEAGGPPRETLLVHARWPRPVARDEAADEEINWLIDLVAAIRSVRSETNVPAAARIPLAIVGAGAREERWLAEHGEAIRRLARISEITLGGEPPAEAAQIVLGELLVALPLAGVVDLSAERARLAKELDRISADIEKIDAKLANPQFVERAPEEVVEEQRERREEAEDRRARVAEALGRLKGAA